MLKKLVINIVSAVLGLYLAEYFVKGLEITGGLKIMLIAGLMLGLVNLFIKPALKLISLPLRIITFGIFGFIINMLIVWLVIDVIMWQNMEIRGLIALFWTTLVIWLTNLVFSAIAKSK